MTEGVYLSAIYLKFEKIAWLVLARENAQHMLKQSNKQQTI